MPVSVRTKIKTHETKKFKEFLDSIGLENVLVGKYQYDIALPGLPIGCAYEDCICYAFMTNDTDSQEMLSYITLKYGDIEKAYRSKM